jgi:hypothetical protein
MMVCPQKPPSFPGSYQPKTAHRIGDTEGYAQT